jgi:hypothetical protein
MLVETEIMFHSPRAKDFPLLQCVQTISGAYSVSCAVGAEGCFLGDKELKAYR